MKSSLVDVKGSHSCASFRKNVPIVSATVDSMVFFRHLGLKVPSAGVLNILEKDCDLVTLPLSFKSEGTTTASSLTLHSSISCHVEVVHAEVVVLRAEFLATDPASRDQLVLIDEPLHLQLVFVLDENGPVKIINLKFREHLAWQQTFNVVGELLQ